MAVETIFAIATGAGRAGVAVVRVSGSQAGAILQTLTGRALAPRRFQRAALRDPRDRSLIDDAVAVWLPGPRSLTGEDCAEFHIHASPAVQSALLTVLSGFSETRIAEAGEFTRRAVLNGKMDLVEAEGLADLLDARTSAQRLLALNQLSGKASSQFEQWRVRLLGIRALLEAAVDFSEEEGVAADAVQQADAALGELLLELQGALRSYANAEVIREGVRVVLAGVPNTGKSSLLNAVAKREAAIVSSIPGTTRDVIEVFLDLGGVPVILTDTAGLRDAPADEIEREGVRRSRNRIAAAEILIWVSAPDVDGSYDMPADVRPDLRVSNKSDMTLPEQELSRYESDRPYRVSARTGLGVPEFIDAVQRVARRYLADADGASATIASERQRSAVCESIRHLNETLGVGALELKAESVARAAHAIGRITGQTDVEEWLGAIFSRFCIGK